MTSRIRAGHASSSLSTLSMGRPRPDDYGHGTHVASSLATASTRTARELASPARILSSVLDGSGRVVSDVIAAIDYAVARRNAQPPCHQSRSRRAYESYHTDPLTLGPSVRCARASPCTPPPEQRAQPGSAHAVWRHNLAGNAPWVLTVGASSHMGRRTAPTTRSQRSPRATHRARPSREARHRRSRHRDRIAVHTGEHALRPRRHLLPGTTTPVLLLEPQRHQHVRTRGERHCGAYAPGQPDPYTECGQGHPPA